MDKLIIPKPFSGGILLSYKCTSECQHCMYACSAKWSEDWISIGDLIDVLSQLAALMKQKYPSGLLNRTDSQYRQKYEVYLLNVRLYDQDSSYRRIQLTDRPFQRVNHNL